MRNSMPTRWIEQTEAMQVLQAARFNDRPRHAVRSSRSFVEPLRRMRDRLSAAMSINWAVPQLQPVPVGRSRPVRVVARDDCREWFDRYC